MSLFVQIGGSISSIIIDGYNLIGIHHRDLEAQRNRLIDLLIRYSRKKGHSITVVFDGWKSGGGIETSSVSGGVRIIYSRLAEKADSVIKRIVSTERREWIVVSSDREIAAHAWSMDSIPVPSEEFLPFIGEKESGERAGAGGSGFGEDEGDTEAADLRRGSPWKLSRKEKAIRKALDKL